MDNLEMTVTSVKQFFDLLDVSPEQLSKMSQSKSMKSLKTNLSKKAPVFKPPVSFYEHLFKYMVELLDIEIPEILGNAWSKYKDLRKYCDPKKYPPDETFFVHLGEHTIHSEHTPSLEPIINDMPIQAANLTFTIKLDFTLKGMILKIKGGKIMEIRIGSCQGKGSIESEGVSLIQKQSKPVQLPGVLALGEGIPIELRAGSSQSHSEKAFKDKESHGAITRDELDISHKGIVELEKSHERDAQLISELQQELTAVYQQIEGAQKSREPTSHRVQSSEDKPTERFVPTTLGVVKHMPASRVTICDICGQSVLRGQIDAHKAQHLANA